MGRSDWLPQRWRAILLSLTGVLLLVGLGASQASAATCDTSWKAAVSGSWSTPSNWTHGVPTEESNVCITVSGTYTVQIIGQERGAKSLQLGGGTGTQTLSIIGTSGNQATLALGSGGAIAHGALLTLTENCSAANCVGSPAASLINNSTTVQLSNAGTITALAGSDGGLSSRELAGDIVNTGTITLAAPVTYAVPEATGEVGTLDNRGAINLADHELTLLFDPVYSTVPTIDNDTGGTITNGGGTGSVVIAASGRFIQGGGTTSPSAVDPKNPAVQLSDVTYTDPLPALMYKGAGKSALAIHGGATLSGNIARGQSLYEDATSCAAESLVTAPSGFTNAGTLTLGGPCDASLTITGGSLVNTGTLVLAATAPGKTREIKGGLINAGTFHVGGSTAFDKSGATLKQTAGATTIAPHAVLDTSGSGSAFQLQGGVLSGGGSSQSAPAEINGPVRNTGGTVIPGSATAPGLMSLGGSYMQGPGGKLTVVIKGTKVASGYSQLSTSGNAAISGTLDIIPLVAPKLPDTYTVVGTSGTRTGKFTRVIGEFGPEGSFPPGWTAGYKPDYEFSNAVALDATAAAGLRVKRSGTGSGQVTSSPAGISCGKACTAPFFQTQRVTLTARPASGSTFAGWSGGCTGKSKTCTVKMNRARTVTAKLSRSG